MEAQRRDKERQRQTLVSSAGQGLWWVGGGGFIQSKCSERDGRVRGWREEGERDKRGEKASQKVLASSKACIH